MEKQAPFDGPSAQQNMENIRGMVEAQGWRAFALIHLLPVAVCITDRNGNFVEINQAYCRLYGYKRWELLGRHFTLVVPEGDKELLSRLHGEFMGKKYELSGEWEVIDSHGDSKSVLANAAYVVNAQGAPFKVTFVLDITNRRQAERQSERAAAVLREELLALERAQGILLHDLAKPLASIKGLCSLMREAVDNPEKMREYLSMLEKVSGRSLELLRSQRKLHDLEMGTYSHRPDQLDLVSEAMQVTDMFLWEYPGRAFRFDLNAPLATPYRGDRFLVSLVLENLLRNALEASPEGASVSLSVREKGGHYKVSVENYGEVPEDVRNRFFDKYATSGKEGGTGLGTYIAKLAVEALGGSITFATGKGTTTISFLLPKGLPSGV